MNIIKPIIFEPITYYPEQDKLSDALVLEGIIGKRDKWDVYSFRGTPIPRVSEILKECIGKNYLLKWALRLGEENYYRESRETLITGTIVHEMIEYFLLYRIKKEIHYRSYNMKVKSERCYNNFLSWYNDRINLGYKITPLYTEKEITCPWYGGTIDCIMNITHTYNYNKNFVVDFKSSKQISIDYFLQTFAYLWAIKWNYIEGIDKSLPHIDGIGIIRVDKETDKYESLFLEFDNPEHEKILNDISFGFFSMLSWYYHMVNLNYDLRLAKKIKNKEL